MHRCFKGHVAPPPLEARWRAFFAGFDLGYGPATPALRATDGAGAAPPEGFGKGAYALVNAYRALGHYIADLDPLGHSRRSHPLLDMAEYGFAPADLDLQVGAGGFLGPTDGGLRLGQLELDVGAMMARQNRVVQTLMPGIAGLFRKHRVDMIPGTARLVSPTAVEVRQRDGNTTLHAARILIAAGSAPMALPALPFDGRHILCSTEALAFAAVPERLVVIGAGAVGLELGSVWSRLGAEVLVVEVADRILLGMDRDLTGQLQRSLERQGLRFRLRTSAEAAEMRDGKVDVQLVSGTERHTVTCDHVLVAVGRRPYTEGLGVDDLGMAVDDRGRIVVNQRFETSVAGIYAIGDVIAGPMLAHKAEEEGLAAVEGMAGRAVSVHYQAIPSVVYTFPELASVGLTEAEAQARGLTVRVGKFPLTASGRARCLEATEGLVKVVGDATTDRLLGVHLLAVRASDLIAEGVIAMEFAASVEDLALSVHAHPTLPEAIKEASLAALQRAIHL
jgi:dihydrolipoamide dehydrogenase